MPVPETPGWYWWQPPAGVNEDWADVEAGEWMCLEVWGHKEGLYVSLWEYCPGEMFQMTYGVREIGGEWGPRIQEPEEKPDA